MADERGRGVKAPKVRNDAVAVQVNALHEEFLGAARKTLQIGIKIGALLEVKKAGLAHGEWLPWCERNLAFNVRTAQNYMRLHARRAELKSENVSHLSDAYRLLKTDSEPAARETRPARRGVTALAKRDPIEEIAPMVRRWERDHPGLVNRLRLAARILAGR